VYRTADEGGCVTVVVFIGRDAACSRCVGVCRESGCFGPASGRFLITQITKRICRLHINEKQTLKSTNSLGAHTNTPPRGHHSLAVDSKHRFYYGVVTISRLLEFIGLSCRLSSL